MQSQETEVQETAAAKVFNPQDPDTIVELNKLLTREQLFFAKHRIQKREDGTHWARIAVTPTEEELSYSVTEHTLGLMRNRGQLVEYFKQNIEKLNKEKFSTMLCNPAVTNHFNNNLLDTQVRYTVIPSEYALGQFSDFSIVQNNGVEEVHCEFSPASGDIPSSICEHEICGSLFVSRKDAFTWNAKDLCRINCFYLDIYYNVDDRRERTESFWHQHIRQSLSK